MKNKKRLGVNIDHVATVRNARGEKYPSPLRAALLAKKCGADSVTIHLREDRRHIKDNDLKEIKSKLKIPLNLEIAATKEMLNISLVAAISRFNGIFNFFLIFFKSNSLICLLSSLK